LKIQRLRACLSSAASAMHFHLVGLLCMCKVHAQTSTMKLAPAALSHPFDTLLNCSIVKVETYILPIYVYEISEKTTGRNIHILQTR
jgi:hypothetical protein